MDRYTDGKHKETMRQHGKEQSYLQFRLEKFWSEGLL